MNILVVHETEYIDKMVFEYQIIPEIWASRGHRVYVIDFPLRWKKKHFFDIGFEKSATIRNVKKSNRKKGITLIHPAIVKAPILDRFVAALSYFFLIPKTIKKYEIDAIFLYSVPTNGFQTVFWARKLKVPIHFRLLDVLHQLVPNKLLSFLTRVLERIVYPRADEMTAITPRLTKYAVSMGAGAKTTSYLPSASDSSLFYPRLKDKKLLKRFSIKKTEKILLFAGTLYDFSGLDKLINFWGRHKENYKCLKLIICGSGVQMKLLGGLIKRYRLEDQIFLTGFINYTELPKYINLADVCINPFESNPITNRIFPGKIYQYQACGKPTIATPLEGVVEIFPNIPGKYGIYYFDLKRPKEFFDLAQKIAPKKFEDPNPQLEEIAQTLEKRLFKLVKS